MEQRVHRARADRQRQIRHAQQLDRRKAAARPDAQQQADRVTRRRFEVRGVDLQQGDAEGGGDEEEGRRELGELVGAHLGEGMFPPLAGGGEGEEGGVVAGEEGAEDEAGADEEGVVGGLEVEGWVGELLQAGGEDDDGAGDEAGEDAEVGEGEAFDEGLVEDLEEAEEGEGRGGVGGVEGEGEILAEKGEESGRFAGGWMMGGGGLGVGGEDGGAGGEGGRGGRGGRGGWGVW